LTTRKVAFAIAGLVIGFVVAFTWTRSINNVATVSESQPQPGAAGTNTQAGSAGQQAGMASVRDIIERAKSNPADFEAQVNAAEKYAQIGRKKEAVVFLEQAYKDDSAQAASMEIPLYIADYYSSQRDYQNAEKWYRAQLSVKPNDAELLIAIGATFIDREPPNPDKAIDYLQSALRASPGSAHALRHLTQAYLLKRDTRAAEDSLAKAKQLDPSSNMITDLEKQVTALKSGQQVIIPKE